MNMLSRRQFVAAGMAAAARLSADPLGMPIGCQTYPVRQMIKSDFDGTLRQLADIGYRSIEMCSPFSYKNEYGHLAEMKGSELRQKIQAAGLICESCHFNASELRDQLADRIAWSKDLGLRQMILASFGVRKGAGMSDWVKAAEEANRIGEQTLKSGIQTGFHNHAMEFEKLDGELIYDKLLSTLDAKLVKLQFQVSVISQGYHAADYFTKYPGRFISIHLQDWSPQEKKQVAVGQGAVDWKKLFGAAKKGGVKNYFVELNLDQMKESYSYLRNLKV
jgi:sugar phosphate isomerase/epimerase